MILGVILEVTESPDDGWEPAVRNMVDVLRSARVTDIVLVTRNGAISSQQLPWFAGTIHAGPEFSDQLQAIRSITAGSLASSHHGIMICPLHFPEFNQSTVVSILQGFWTSRKNLIIPVYAGRRGYPVIIGQSLYSRLGQVASVDALAAAVPDEVLEITPGVDVPTAGAPASPSHIGERL